MKITRCCLTTFLLLSTGLLQAQTKVLKKIEKVGEFSGTGIVEDYQPGRITVRHENGKQQSFLIQNQDERFVSLDGNEYIIPMPCKIRVQGTLPGRLLEKGMVVEFQGEMNRAGRTGKPISKLNVLSNKNPELKIEPLQEPTGKELKPCKFVGIVQQFVNQTMYLSVPKTKFSPTQRITAKVAKEATFDIGSDDLNRVLPGDIVSEYSGDTMANGAMVIRDIAIRLTAEREVATTSFSDQLYLKYSKLSDEPAEAREERSAHFVLYTDVSLRSSKVLLEKLETMYGFLFRYYRKKPKEPIVCYVVADVKNFSKIPSDGIRKIEARAGVTASQRWTKTRGNRVKGKFTRSVVYSCDDHDVVQHEAVHAYCNMAFGTAGPVWYAEGMAEMGQYWAPEQQAIHIEPVVIEYLTNSPKKEMLEIVAAGQITGDSWQAYSWRWALCHLLANNPNYSKRFHELGVNLMMEEHDSFRKAFGRETKKISFEYDQFVANFDNGYRTDLCVWQWTDDAEKLESKASFTVQAKQGWQSTSLILEKDNGYDFVCPSIKNDAGDRVQQTWKIKPTIETTPEGNPRGDGKLIGAILHDYKLSEPFELGSKKIGMTVPESGQLYVRCQEKWNAIDDNDGQLKVYIRKTPKP